MITDFSTGRQIDIDSLFKMIRYAEETPDEDFSMNHWINECGTAGCMCGTFLIREKRIRNDVNIEDQAMCLRNEFGLSKFEFGFLFTSLSQVFNNAVDWDCDCEVCTKVNGLPVNKYNKVNGLYKRNAFALTKQQAISRLRKFIAYKIRKSQLLNDPQARLKEGNWNLVLEALNSVAV